MSKSYTTFNIAKILDVYPTTVARWVDDGKLKAYTTPGGHRRITAGDLRLFLHEHNMPIPPELKGEETILIVDDEKPILRTVTRALNRHTGGYSIKTAQDGFEAGRLYAEYSPALVILDIALPGIDGFKVCELIRKQSNETKILVITGFPTMENRKKMLEAGADLFMAKPFELKELTANVLRLLKGADV